MSTTTQEKIIEELRSKAAKVTYAEKPKAARKIDRAALWKLAQKAGRTFRDDSIPTSDISGS